MSAVLQLPGYWEGFNSTASLQQERSKRKQESAALTRAKSVEAEPVPAPVVTLSFYRKHTERTLRRYLYASMQVGRSPSILGDPVARGWCSSRPVRTFEDAVIFVLDVERCLDKLGSLDRQLLSRIVLQEYTQAEAATLIGMSARSVAYKFPEALDRLTEKLLESSLLILPN
jgi:DNA-directed RNA polymerase specialized sigma24 family protein